MFEQIKVKLDEEKTQRFILGAVGTVATFIVANVVSNAMNGAIDSGIDKLMKKWHPVIEEIIEAVGE